MIMINDIWVKFLSWFNKDAKSETSDRQRMHNNEYASKYQDIRSINFNAIFSNKIATMTVAESDFIISEDNKRAELLNNAGQAVWKKIKKIAALSLGTGGVLIVPYIQNGNILFNIVTQDRLSIDRKNGELITSATILAEKITQNNVCYYRFTNYNINNGNLIITNKTVDEYGNYAVVEKWRDLKDFAISNVDRVPFGYIKSPIDNRRSSDNYGVPVTYGCDSIIKEIYECLGQIRDEFLLKEVRLQVDERMFDKDEKGRIKPLSKLFFKGKSNNGDLFNIFNPAIRESSYYNRLSSLFELLEKEVGTSKGILTAPETRGATATEIKAGLYDTYSIICDMRKNIETGINDYLYACDILANYYGLSPSGEYKAVFDWSFALIESSSETWQQMKDAQAIGIRSKAELRAWQTGETIEEAQKAVDEITAKEPTMQSLLGMNNDA